MEIARRTLLASGLAVSGVADAAAAVDVTCGLTIAPMLDATPPALRVVGIDWFSGFRASGLQRGDEIIAVDGVPITHPATPEDARRTAYRLIGGTSEAQAWADARKSEGARVTLKLRRRANPAAQGGVAQGWVTLDVTGTLRGPMNARSADNRVLIGPGGPQEMFQNDGFSDSWRAWADDLAKSASAVLDDPLYALQLTSENELRQLAERRARATVLAQKYPGPFAQAVAQDIDAMQARLAGPAITLPADALHYRELGAEKAGEISRQAAAGWAALQTELAGKLLNPIFPAVHPVHGDRASVIGKYVVLPPLTNRDWIGEAGHTWFVAGSRENGWYFADAEGTEAGLLLDAVARYRRLVVPNIQESYQLLGQVQDQPGQLVIGERAYFGLKLKPVAALVGDAMFVDLRHPQGNEARFAGEDLLRRPSAAPPPASASPAEVMAAMVAALKAGDQALWTSLFATWGVQYTNNGQALFYANAVHQPDSYFEEARRRIMERVFDMRPVWVDDPRAIIPGNQYPGQLRLEEVTVEMQHIGQFGGQYRAFSDVTVHRWWQLQRLGSGPWRITSLQPI